MWPIVGLSYGTVLGLAGAFGGFTAFALVLDLAEMFTRRSA